MASMAAGEWLELAGTAIDNIAAPVLDPVRSRSNVIGAWSGGAYDDHDRKLHVLGGGHDDYNGTEIYAIDVKNGTVAMHVDSQAWPPGNLYNSGNSPVMPDGVTPTSRHTYGTLQIVGRYLYMLGGDGYWNTGSLKDTKVRRFHLDNLTWEEMTGDTTGTGERTGSWSAAHPDGDQIWFMGPGGDGNLSVYSISGDTVTAHVAVNLGNYLSAIIRKTVSVNQFILVGGTSYSFFDLDSPASAPTTPTPTGDTAPVTGDKYGMDYSPSADRIVAYAGGSDIFVCNPETHVWTQYTLGGDVPGAASAQGTYGRFRYMPAYDRFVTVNATNQNAFVCRLPGGA